jgi:hypothetical protein
VVHRFRLLKTHDRKQDNPQPHSSVTQGVCDFWGSQEGKVLDTDIMKVNDYFTLNDVALVDKLGYNLLSVSQLVDTDLDVLVRKSGSQVLDYSGKRVCGISPIEKVF